MKFAKFKNFVGGEVWVKWQNFGKLTLTLRPEIFITSIRLHLFRTNSTSSQTSVNNATLLTLLLWYFVNFAKFKKFSGQKFQVKCQKFWKSDPDLSPRSFHLTIYFHFIYHSIQLPIYIRLCLFHTISTAITQDQPISYQPLYHFQ